MAAYGRGDYGGGAYSFGAYLGEVLITSSGTVAITGVRVKDAAFDIISTTAVEASGERIATAGVPIVSTSAVTIDGGLEARGAVDFVAQSTLAFKYTRSRKDRMAINGTSLMTFGARKKWETIPDVQTNWTTVN